MQKLFIPLFKVIILFFIFILSCSPDISDPNEDDKNYWQKSYGYGDAKGYSLIETNDKGFIIVGEKWISTSKISDVFIVCTDSIGEMLWTKTYGGSDYDYGFSVQQTIDGGFIIAGGTHSYGAGSRDVYLIRTDVNGDTIWTKTYGGDTLDWATSIDLTNDGGFIVAGHTKSFGAGDYDIYLLRTDMNGDTLWTKTYGGADWEYGNSIQTTNDDGFIIAGHTWSFGSGSADFYLIKTGSNGEIIWAKTYGGRYHDAGNSVQECSSGGYMVTGDSRSFGVGKKDVYLVRTDLHGDTLWTKTFGGADDDLGLSGIQTSDGKYAIAGYSYSFSGHPDFYLVCLDKE